MGKGERLMGGGYDHNTAYTCMKLSRKKKLKEHKEETHTGREEEVPEGEGRDPSDIVTT